MTYEIFLALVGFAFVSSITPGPNNLMLMASGANFGFRRSIPHMIGLGLAGLFHAWPPAVLVLKITSVVYMLWLAWKIAHSAAPGSGEVSGKPMTFLQAALFQWVNPKAWAMALTATSVYAPGQTVAAITLVAAVFGVVNLPSVSVWTLIGQELQRILSNPARLRLFNWTMAVLLVASLWPVLRL